jgi:predicted nucleotidyltransferase
MITNTIKLSDELVEQITAALQPLHPEKVILFGSYAWGRPTEDSDIDLVVVLREDRMPQTYQDRAANRLRVRRALDAVNREYAIDLLVYTAPEWRMFQESGSSFAKEILSRGIEL